MTTYQKVTVLWVERRAVVVEVHETNQSRAISCLVDRGAARGIADGREHTDPLDRLAIAAQLLLGEKAMDGELEPLDEDAGPEQLVSGVEVLSATKIGEGDSYNSIYQATLRITVTKPSLARPFAPGESFGALADIGNDFGDFFG